MKKGGGGGGGGERAVAKGGGEEGVGEGVAVERETGRQTTASRRGSYFTVFVKLILTLSYFTVFVKLSHFLCKFK